MNIFEHSEEAKAKPLGRPSNKEYAQSYFNPTPTTVNFVVDSIPRPKDAPRMRPQINLEESLKNSLFSPE